MSNENIKRDIDYARKLRKKRERMFLLYVLPVIMVITIVCTAVYILQLKDQIYKSDLEIADLQSKIAENESYNKSLEKSLNDSAAVIDGMAIQLENLQTQNDDLCSRLSELEKHIEDTTVVPKATISKHTDLKVQAPMTTDRMNLIIDQWNIREGGTVRFKGHGQAFITASKMTGIDPVALLALSGHESGFGTSRIARDKNNFMGIAAYDNSPYSSSYVMGDDIDQGIINGAMWIANNYYEQGQTTLYAMIYGNKQYSTSKDKWINDIVWLWNTSYDLV